MKKTADRRLAKSERTRNIGQEILRGIREIKSGRVGRRFTVDSFAIVRARGKSGRKRGSKIKRLIESS